MKWVDTDRVLEELESSPVPLTAGEIARRIGADLDAVARTLHRLE